MNRILALAILLLAAMSATAADSNSRDPEQVSIATTGRIVRIDLKNKIFKVRGSDNQSVRNISQMMQSLTRKVGIPLPSGITIPLLGRVGKSPSKPATDTVNSLDEYTVVITSNTLFQDGGDTIRVEDFKAGETISIHGVLSGSTLTASRIAKWF